MELKWKQQPLVLVELELDARAWKISLLFLTNKTAIFSTSSEAHRHTHTNTSTHKHTRMNEFIKSFVRGVGNQVRKHATTRSHVHTCEQTPTRKQR